MHNMIYSRSDLIDWLRTESAFYCRGNKFEFYLRGLFGFESNLIWKFQRQLRYTEYHLNSGHKIRYVLHKRRLNKLQLITGLHICENVCGRGLHIMHIGPILTNAHASIGENCTIHVNTAIVANGHNGKCPQIGNNVIIGVGAVLLGDIHIADGIVIGANAVVNRSFLSDNIAIAGQPARKISDNGSRTWNNEKST